MRNNYKSFLTLSFISLVLPNLAHAFPAGGAGEYLPFISLTKVSQINEGVIAGQTKFATNFSFKTYKDCARGNQDFKITVSRNELTESFQLSNSQTIQIHYVGPQNCTDPSDDVVEYQLKTHDLGPAPIVMINPVFIDRRP